MSASPSARLDHLVVAATSLEAGTSWLESLGGPALANGGSHPRMGTHNRLARLGDGAFLEIIAVDPDAAAPPRPRWYGLDSVAVRERLSHRPSLLTWAVGVDDLDAALAAAGGAGVEAGEAIEQARGELRWRIGVPADGSLPEGGAFPTLIEWPPGVDATARMDDHGLRLEALRVAHPDPARIAAALAAIGLDSPPEIAQGPVGVSASLTDGGCLISL